MIAQGIIWYSLAWIYVSIRTIISYLSCWVIGIYAGHIRFAEEGSVGHVLNTTKNVVAVFGGAGMDKYIVICDCVCIHIMYFPKEDDGCV